MPFSARKKKKKKIPVKYRTDMIFTRYSCTNCGYASHNLSDMRVHASRKKHDVVKEVCSSNETIEVPMDISYSSVNRDRHLIEGEPFDAVQMERDCVELDEYFIQWTRRTYGNLAPSKNRSIKVMKKHLKHPWIEFTTTVGTSEKLYRKCHSDLIRTVFDVFKKCHNVERVWMIEENESLFKVNRLLIDHFARFVRNGDIAQLSNLIDSGRIPQSLTNAFFNVIAVKESPEIDRYTCRCGYKSYQKTKTELVVIAGENYGCGSSRDVAAKGPLLLGIRAIIAKGFERIHRSNLVGMGLLPLEFLPGNGIDELGIVATDLFTIKGLDKITIDHKEVDLLIQKESGDVVKVKLKARLDNPDEVIFWKNGGILQTAWKEA